MVAKAMLLGPLKGMVWPLTNKTVHDDYGFALFAGAS